MSNLWSIVEKNYATFYRYDTNTAVRSGWRLVLTIALSAALSLWSDRTQTDFLIAVLTVQAILAGFSFSVVFFLMSEGNRPTTVDASSIERKLRSERLRKLGKELFHNVSYFNLVTLSSVAIALILLIPLASVGSVLNTWLPILREHNIIGDLATVKFWILKVLLAAFYFLLIESLYNFIRTVLRATYLFESRLRAQDED